MGKGDNFILMERGGKRFEALIEALDGQDIIVKLKRVLPTPQESLIEINLCQALIRSRSMDYIIEKTSELGVNQILPFFSERSIVKLNKEKATSRIRHWHEIAKSAMKQADRTRPAEIFPPVPFEDLLKRWSGAEALRVILWEEEGSRDLRDLLRSSRSRAGFTGIVGPEGGFSQRETALAEEAGFIPVSLGRRILRTETAAIVLVAIMQYEWGDLNLG